MRQIRLSLFFRLLRILRGVRAGFLNQVFCSHFLILCAVGAAGFWTKSAHAFVENTVKGYPNCMACHVSPTGGGLLNDYGRTVSNELMSTWQIEGFERPLGGLVQNTERVKIGGHIRTVQTRSEDERRSLGRFFLMQQNVEVGLRVGAVQVVGTLGTQEGPRGVPNRGEFLSERHYVLLDLGEGAFLRAGKFRSSYGLNDPNHTRLTQQGLGFGALSETYQAEVAKFYEWGEVVVAGDVGRMDAVQRARDERRLMLQLTSYGDGESRFTFNVLRGLRDNGDLRHLVGFNGIQPLLSKFYFSYQFDYSHLRSLERPETEGLFSFFQLGTQPFQGLWSYLLFEGAQTNLKQSQTQVTAPGIGLRWLPLAHFEFQFEHQLRREKQTNRQEHRSFLMMHVYL